MKVVCTYLPGRGHAQKKTRHLQTGHFSKGLAWRHRKNKTGSLL